MNENKKEKKKISLSTYLIILILLIIIVSVLICVIIKLNVDKVDKESVTQNTIAQEEELSDNNITNEVIEKDSDTNTETNENTAVSQDIDKEDFIVLYNGEEIKQDVGKQALSYCMKNTSANKKRYSIKYYNYEKNKYKGETKGVFGKEDLYEGYSFVDNVSEIAISKKYNAIPRKSEKVDNIKLPEKLNDIWDYSNVDIETVDLDGDGEKEYIFCLQQKTSKEDYDVDENEAYSELVLFNSKFDKIATFASWENKQVEEFSKDSYLQLNNIIYVDIDNDGIMEILIELPAYESSILNVLKYNDNKISGDTDIKVDMTP